MKSKRPEAIEKASKSIKKPFQFTNSPPITDIEVKKGKSQKGRTKGKSQQGRIAKFVDEENDDISSSSGEYSTDTEAILRKQTPQRREVGLSRGLRKVEL